MLSRKQFLNELLYQGLRFFNDPPGRGQPCAGSSTDVALPIDLPFTEISPSLLVIEAQQRGIPIENGNAETLRKQIYMELSEKCPFAGPNRTKP